MKEKHNLTHQLLLGVFVLVCALLVVGCSDDANPVEPELDSPVASETAGVTFAAKKPDCKEDPTHKSCKEDGGDTGDGSWTFAEAVYHNNSIPPPSENKRPPHWLISNCVADNSGTGGSLNLVWPRHDQCANITPRKATKLDECSEMTTADDGAKPLTDDPSLTVSKKKGMITSVQFYQQDVIGETGIAYKSEVVTIDPAVPFTGAGTLLHIDQNVWVWRHKGHTGGPQVERVGCMHMADIAYRE